MFKSSSLTNYEIITAWWITEGRGWHTVRSTHASAQYFSSKKTLSRVKYFSERRSHMTTSLSAVLQGYATPPDLHLKRDCVSNTRRQSTFDWSALRSGDRSEVAFVHWWDNFPEPVVFSPTTHAFSCRPLGLQSPQIKFLTVVPSVRKHVKQTLCKLFFFFFPRH